MKKLLVGFLLVAISCTVCFLAGCGEQTLKITIGKATIELESGFKEVTPTQAEIDTNATRVYKKDGASYKVEIHSFENHDGLSAEELCRAKGLACGGCVEEKKTPDGKAPAWLVTFAYNEGEDYHTLVKEYFLDDNGEVVSLAYCFYTDKVQLANSNYYMWLPQCFDDAVTEHNDILSAEVTKYQVDESFALADFLVVNSWDEDYSYNLAVKRCKAIGVEPACDEATFNAIGQNGWDIDAFFASLEAICGKAMTDTASITQEDGTQKELRCIEGVLNGTDYIFIVGGFKATDGAELCMVIYGPAKTWPGVGEAYAHSIFYGA